MDFNEFASRLCLRPFNHKDNDDYGRTHPEKTQLNVNQAAVLVPIIEREHGLNILFTQRAWHLRSHPGQISFPGGKYEPNDESLVATAIRESEEEIGLNKNSVQPLCWMPDLFTVSNFNMSPLVALVDGNQDFVANQDEVHEIFEVPLSYLLARSHQFYLTPKWRGKPHKIHFIRYKNKLIWGATAAILQKLLSHIE